MRELRQVEEGVNTLIASPETSHSRCRIYRLTRVSRSLPHRLDPTLSQPIASVRHPLDLTVDDTRPHGMQLSSYSNLALSLAHHFHPRASIAPASGTRQGAKLADQGGGDRAHSTIREVGGRAATLLPSLPSYPDTSYPLIFISYYRTED